jgi:hypothetical protein
MENTAMNGLEWSQTANIAYRALGSYEQKNIDLILNSLLPEDLLSQSNQSKNEVFIFRVPPFLRLLLKRDGSKIRLIDIVDKRAVDALFGNKVS